MYAFDLKRPGTLDEAVKALGEGEAQALGGGQTLIPSLKARLAAPVAAVANLIERTWTLAAPMRPMQEAAERKEVGGSSAPLDERDQAILALLASGASDQVIARRRGISVRTVERRVRYIMEHLGAATRFHAGAQAVRRGWV